MGDSTPICRCRVLYLGSAVPRQSKDGLQGIQEPLRSLYPSEGAVGAKGIDSWLSVWSNGILLENVDENRKQVTHFFPIESLHYCAAVRQVLIPERGNNNPEPKFLPLDSPFARTPKAQHPPIFAAILRRTTGIKVLECHVFICKREAAANALVRCCFHAYADNSYARQLEVGGSNGGGSVYGTLGKPNGSGEGLRSRTGSTTTLSSIGRTQVNGVNGMNGVNDAYTVKNSEFVSNIPNHNVPSIPVPRPDSTSWSQSHERFKANTANNPNIPIIFYGDSITERWFENGISVFEQYFAPLGVANYGIGGDRTQWLSWRILNGEMQGLNPKLVVLKIGTNNVARDSDSATGKGITNVVGTLRRLLPNTKILLISLLPRTGVEYFNSIVGINARIRNLHNGRNIFYLDMFNQFHNDNAWGVVPSTLFSDGIHLTAAGYQLWADIMNPLLNELIQ